MIRNCVQTNGVIMWKTLDTDEATSERTQNTYTHCAATSRGRLYAILCLSACVFFLSRLRVEKKCIKKWHRSILWLAFQPCVCALCSSMYVVNNADKCTFTHVCVSNASVWPYIQAYFNTHTQHTYVQLADGLCSLQDVELIIGILEDGKIYFFCFMNNKTTLKRRQEDTLNVCGLYVCHRCKELKSIITSVRAAFFLLLQRNANSNVECFCLNIHGEVHCFFSSLLLVQGVKRQRGTK